MSVDDGRALKKIIVGQEHQVEEGEKKAGVLYCFQGSGRLVHSFLPL